MAFAIYKDLTFRFGFSVLQIPRERDIKAYKYPGRSGAEHEDFGSIPQVFTVEADFPGDFDGKKDLRKLESIFDQESPGSLEIPDMGVFHCFLRKFQESAQAGGNGMKRIELEFVETLPEDLVIQRSPDELEDMRNAAIQITGLSQTVSKKIKLPEIEIPAWLKTLFEILDFINEARQKIKDFQQKIQDIQDAVTRPYNELMRLAADIEQLANKARSLYQSAIKFAQLPFTIAMRLKNTANILSSIGRRFLPPPVDRRGEVIADSFHGQVLLHTVVGGDTMQSISLRYYDSALLWECLAEANGVTDANDLQIGDVLVIPEFGGQRKQRVEVRPGKTRIGQATCEA